MVNHPAFGLLANTGLGDTAILKTENIAVQN